MGLKSLGGALRWLAGVALKSDQNGIEMVFVYVHPSLDGGLKSDQNGIEIELKSGYVYFLPELKSDQNGIEIKIVTQS